MLWLYRAERGASVSASRDGVPASVAGSNKTPHENAVFVAGLLEKEGLRIFDERIHAHDVTSFAASAAVKELISMWGSHARGGWSLEQLIVEDVGLRGERIAALLVDWLNELRAQLGDYRAQGNVKTGDTMDWNGIEEQIIGLLTLVMKENGAPFSLLEYCFEAAGGGLPKDYALRRREMERLTTALQQASERESGREHN